MELAVLVILSLLCAALALRVYTVERALRKAAAQLRAREHQGSCVRIAMAAPNAAAEAVLEEVNHLLELRQADEADYREREQALRRQIANVSHDLRTPLTSILGYLQLLEGENLTEAERREYLGVVESRARALQSLIASFYDLSRLEGGEYPLVREQVDLYAALSSQLAAFYGDLEAAGLRVTVELEEDLPPVWGDSAGVLRVFGNLIRNVLDHGSGELEVRLFREGEQLVSTFTNDARDLKEEDMAKVFDRSFTSDRTRGGGNAGLGLAIVRALTEQMGHRAEASLCGGRFTVAVYWNKAAFT